MYEKTTWVDGITVANATNLNHIEEGIYNLYNAIFPVGQIVIKGDNEDYSNWLGLTWERTAVGKVLVGIDSNDTDFNALGKTGGEKTHTITQNELPANTIINTAGNLYVESSGWQSIGNKTSSAIPMNNLQPYQVVAYWKRIS